MFANRKELESNLEKVKDIIYNKSSLLKAVQTTMLEKHGVLPGSVNSILLGMQELSDLNEETLLWYTKEIQELLSGHGEYSTLAKELKLETYFTKNEIISFSKSAIENSENNIYPIVLSNVLQVNSDQWVTVKDVNFLKKLHDNQIINYNKNTQRNLTVRTNGQEQTYKITLKQKSVDSIEKLLAKSLFISNALTLNINKDSIHNEFDYSQEDGTITLTKGQLDIIDGYHRYRGIMHLKNVNPNFNYNWIINIMNFNEEKACTYIAQEDKRNKISTKHSVSLDYTQASNRIVKSLNEDSDSCLFGSIGRMGTELIDFSTLSRLIDYHFKSDDNREVLRVSRYLKKSFNSLDELDESVFSKSPTFMDLCIIIRVFFKYENEEEAAAMTSVCLKNKGKLKEAVYLNKKVRKVLFNDIDKLVEEMS